MSHPENLHPVAERRSRFDSVLRPSGHPTLVIGHSSLDIPRRKRRGGFALLITITLLAFLVLLLVSLASLTRVETQVASNNQSIAQARQNALMALNLALGQLQRHTGPDQRVTATADLQPLATEAAPATYPTTDPASGVSLNGTTSTVLSSIDTYWRASRNRRWTGAWKNNNSATFDPENPTTVNATANTVPVWLVSGNETSPTFVPTTAPAGLSVTADPVDPNNTIKNASDVTDYPAGRPYRILVGRNTTGATTATHLDRFVTAPQVPIKSTNVPGTNGASTTVGNYAWWIGDEGVKARANLVDPYAAAPSGETDDEKLIRETIRSQSAQRPAIEAMTTTGTDGLAPTYPANNQDLLKVFTPSQLGYLAPSATFQTELKNRFHDLSVSSRGVLADVKNGGLKTDLTYLLGQPNLTAFRTALNAAYGTSVAPSPDYNPVISLLSTPLSAQPADFVNQPAGNAVPANIDLFSFSATWEQLWSFHNTGNLTTATPAGIFDPATGHAVPRLHSGTQHGLNPLVIQAKLFYRLRIVGGTAVAEPPPNSHILVNRTGEIHIDVIPIVVLANPYNVTLATRDYRLAFNGGQVNLRVGKPTDPDNPTRADFIDSPPNPTGSIPSLPLGNNSTGAIRFRIKSPEIKPGEALVFSLENPSTTIPSGANNNASTALQQALSVNMVNEFLPTHALTYNTRRTIPAAHTHVALLPQNGTLGLKLYSDDFTEALGDRTMIRFFNPRTFDEEDLETIFMVDPITDGTKQGGGIDSYVLDATFGAGLYGDPLTTRKDQVGIFYQVNYRALTVADAAATSFESNNRDIARSWARTRIKGGSSAGSASFNPYIAAHLVFDGSSLKRVRWGIYNNGAGTEGDQPPPQLIGNTGLNTILYDVPRAAHPLSSLGQLQHFNLAGHFSRTPFNTGGTRNDYNLRALSFQNNYPIGNSYSNALLNRERLMDFDYGMSFQHDGSYLWNHALFDRFFFSTYPQSGPFDFATNTLTHSRLKPWRDTTAVPPNDPQQFRGDGSPATAANSRIAAKNLLLEGAFNVNSTSVEAWKAILSSLKNIPVGKEEDTDDLTAPYTRTLYQSGQYNDEINGKSTDGNTVNSWTGTFNLTPLQINQLAEEIVLQVRKRGPFLSMSDFTNRRLIAKAADTLRIGLSGALQSAIDKVVNQPADVHADVRTPTRNREFPGGKNRRIPDDDARMPTGISGYPGYLLQGDVLSAIGASLTVRSDTFTIRTYGDAVNPATGEVTGRAWCEATVQRTPDYVDATAADTTPTSGTPADTFGRRYQITSFRWLTPEDI